MIRHGEAVDANMILNILKYGYENDEFTLRKMFEDLNIGDNELGYVKINYVTEFARESTPNHLLCVVLKDNAKNYADWTYRLLPNALFNYIDHLEIVEARKAATDSKRLS